MKKATALKLFSLGFLILLIGVPALVLAQGYVPLAPIDGYITQGSTVSLSDYLNTMFRLGIGVATALAVIMIIIGGIQLVSTDSVTGQLQGKDRITSALWGLVLALAAWVILQTINPQLLNTNLQINNGTSQTSQ